MEPPTPVTTLVTYRPQQGEEERFFALLEKHWPALDQLGLVTKKPVRIWRATDKRTNRQYWVELFQWKDESSSSIAHQTPEVMAIWEPMGAILEDMQLARLEQVI
jgi:hypothetical protein